MKLDLANGLLDRLKRLEIVAYGCRHGTHPPALDRIYDCRKARNPHHDKRLRELTGLDDPVRDEVLMSAMARALLRQIEREVLELFETRDTVRVGVYCTGGRHRSVVIAIALLHVFLFKGYAVQVALRDRGSWVESAKEGDDADAAGVRGAQA